jgi:hypothetical protein
MNPLGKTRKRLRLTLLVATLLLAAGAGYDIEISPHMYLESATVELSLPKAQNAPNAYYMFAPSLIASGEAMVQILMSPSVQRQIGATRRGDSVSLALVNLYNEEYPYYGVPLATLTAASPAAADTHHTFAVAAHALRLLLAAQQKQAGVPPRERISARILGDSGPVIQTGSRARVFGGLALLAAMAVGLAWDGAGRWGAGAAPYALAARAAGRRPGSRGGGLSGSHQERLSRYHCTVARRPAANGVPRA